MLSRALQERGGEIADVQGGLPREGGVGTPTRVFAFVEDVR